MSDFAFGGAAWRTRQNLNITSSLILTCWPHDVKTWRYPQNPEVRNLLYCCREGPNYGHNEHVPKISRKFEYVCIFSMNLPLYHVMLLFLVLVWFWAENFDSRPSRSRPSETELECSRDSIPWSRGHRTGQSKEIVELFSHPDKHYTYSKSLACSYLPLYRCSSVVAL